MRITLTNNFHNSESIVSVPRLPYTLSTGQSAKVRRELCGLRDCTCGVVRGRQWQGRQELTVEQDADRRYTITGE